MSSTSPIVAERLIAHRGSSAHAPENTLAAMREAASRGARWVEIDVKLTRDQRPVIIHDNTLNRTTNGTGYVAAHRLEEIRALDAGSWFGREWAGETIPTFEELLETVLACDLGLQVELKPTAGDDVETAEIACAMLKERWPRGRGRLFIASFSVRALARAARLLPEVPRAFAVVVPPKDPAALLKELDCQILHVTCDLLDDTDLARLKASGIEFAVATINDRATAERLIAAGAQSVLSDRADLL